MSFSRLFKTVVDTAWKEMTKLTKHGKIIHRMMACGYKGDHRGICYGIAHMGMQAILARDSNVFDKRLNRIWSIPLDEFAAVMKKARRDYRKSRKKSFDLSILAFFEGIELYQHPYLYPDLFEPEKYPRYQDESIVIPVLTPEKLDESGIVNSHYNCGVYTFDTVEIFFKCIIQAIHTVDLPSQQPIALMVYSTNHCITLGYDPRTNDWLFIDANQLPTIRIMEADDAACAYKLAYRVINSFPYNGNFICHTQFFSLSSDETALNQMSEYLQSLTAWRNIHVITEQMAKAKNAGGDTLLGMEVIRGKAEIIPLLLKMGAEVDYLPTNVFSTPLCLAAQNDDIHSVNALLSGNANANHAFPPNGVTPLLLAIEDKSVSCVRALLEVGANANQSLVDGTTPLKLAVCRGQIEIVKLLLDYHADIDATFTVPEEELSDKNILSFVTAFSYKKEAQTRMAAFIRQQPDRKNITLTAENLAEIFGRQDILELLREKKNNVALRNCRLG